LQITSAGSSSRAGKTYFKPPAPTAVLPPHGQNIAEEIMSLKHLETESIYIIREFAAQAQNPVMLYSIGKDSSVMLRLVQKAFYPSKPPFPFLHVDTTWKFKEMIRFRDETMQNLGFNLIVHTNPDGADGKITPFKDGSSHYTDVMKTTTSSPAPALPTSSARP
jgi:sulfate adenylyltransferase subunit 2